MDYQKFVDGIETMTCVLSVETYPDGGFGNIRIVAGNKAYIDSIEDKQNISSLQMLDQKFVPGSPYERYIPKDLNFEHAVYRCAAMKKTFHTYIHLDRYSFWIDVHMIPLVSEEPNIFYCIQSQEFTVEVSSDRMSDLAPSVASSVLKTSFKLKGAKTFKADIQEVIDDISEMCGANSCCILLTDFNERKCSVLCQSTTPIGFDKSMEEHMEETGFDFFDIVEKWEEAIAGSSCLIIRNNLEMEVLRERSPIWYASLCRVGIESLVLFPLIYNDETLGYIWAVNFDTENADTIKEILEYTTHIIASAIANYQHVNRLGIMVAIDMLTGVNNRNAMNNRVDEFVRCPQKLPDRFGIVAVDLNGLKTVNDTEGHNAGDALLTNAADILKRLFDGCEIYRSG
ncbi:MAG: diguanylate cyclase, partial [Ruminiclostridium sp.]|nr:diguanylate cyclase [Ruminiclostridium sp.]